MDSGQRYDDHEDGIINRIADLNAELEDLDEADVIIRNMVQQADTHPIDIAGIRNHCRGITGQSDRICAATTRILCPWCLRG